MSCTDRRTTLTALAPQFLVQDLEAACAFYREVLGQATPWGTREFVVQDPSGYSLYFGQPAA